MTPNGAMSRKGALIGIFLVLLAGSAGALDIYLAPLAYQDDSEAQDADGTDQKRPADDLFQRLAGVETSKSMSLRKIDDAQMLPPESYLDAARLCESQGYPYLLYGYVKRTPYSYYAEVKLITRETKAIAAAFISGDDERHYERLIDDLAAKIVAYVREDLGMGPPRPKDAPATNILTLLVTAGYWTPMGGDWNASMSGLVCANLSLRFVPSLALFHLWDRPGLLAMGLDVEYGLGTNQPGVEPFFLHAAKVRLPVEAVVDLGNGHGLGLSLGPLMEIDTMIQSKLYGPTVTETTIAPGASFSILYRYTLSPSASVGLANTVDITFYNRPLATFSPKLSASFLLAANREKR